MPTYAPYTAPATGGNTPVNPFGSTPQLPSLQNTQIKAIQGDLTNLGALYGLAGNVNQFQNTQAALGLQQNLPGYQNLLNQASTNAQSLLQGQIPQDVINQLTRSAAERGIATGSPGSPNANSALLSALGQTSLGLEQQGLQNFGTLAGMTPQAAPMDLSPYMVTPQQEQDLETAQALYNAAPNPAAAAGANLGAGLGGLGTGLGLGPTAPGMPNLSPGAIGSTVPTYGNPQGGTTYDGTVYPSGTGPSAGPNPSPDQTGDITGATPGQDTTGDPLTDWMLGLSDTLPNLGGDPYNDAGTNPAATDPNAAWNGFAGGALSPFSYGSYGGYSAYGGYGAYGGGG